MNRREIFKILSILPLNLWLSSLKAFSDIANLNKPFFLWTAFSRDYLSSEVSIDFLGGERIKRLNIPPPLSYIHSLRSQFAPGGWQCLAFSKSLKEGVLVHYHSEQVNNCNLLKASEGHTLCGHGDFLQGSDFFCYGENLGVEGRSHLVVAKLENGQIFRRIDLEKNDVHEIRSIPWEKDIVLAATSDMYGTYMTKVNWQTGKIISQADPKMSDILFRHFDFDPVRRTVVVSGKWREETFKKKQTDPKSVVTPQTLLMDYDSQIFYKIKIPESLIQDFKDSIQLLSLSYAASSDLFYGTIDNKAKICWVNARDLSIGGVFELKIPENFSSGLVDWDGRIGKANGVADAGSYGKVFVNTEKGFVFNCDIVTKDQSHVVGVLGDSIHIMSLPS